MPSIRPEVLVFIQAINTLKSHANADPLSDVEAEMVMKSITRLEQSLYEGGRWTTDGDGHP